MWKDKTVLWANLQNFLKMRKNDFSLSDFVAGKRGWVAKRPFLDHNSPQRGLCQEISVFQKSGLQMGLKNRILTVNSRNHAI